MMIFLERIILICNQSLRFLIYRIISIKGRLKNKTQKILINEILSSFIESTLKFHSSFYHRSNLKFNPMKMKTSQYHLFQQASPTNSKREYQI